MKTKDILYNEQQLEALNHMEGPLLIMAGAGSGKTRVLTGKIAKLIEEGIADESEILAFTFTNKAANEMKERISALLGKDISHMWIGTFHSICSRILRMNISNLGYTSNFTIYDSQDQRNLLKEVIKSLDLDPANFKLSSLTSKISNLKSDGVSPSDLYNDASFYLERQIADIYETYEEKKKENNALDFDDLIIKTIEVLKNETLKYYQSKFKYVFVDEYQDTNPSQYELIRLLTGKYKNICVVGDQDQSIYGWRGADISNIINFEKDFPNARVILLERNYRSTENILNAANALIKNNTNRKDKKLWTDQGKGDEIIYKKCQGESDEAEYVVNKIYQMQNRDYSLNEMAILYRTNAQSRAFEERLMREGIPYKVVGGIKFYDRKEIKDLIAYLNLLINEFDDLSLTRIINTPKRGIGDRTLGKLQAFASRNNISLFEALDKDIDELSNGPKKKLKDFKEMINSFKTKKEEMSLESLVMDVYEESGMRVSFENSPSVEDKSRIENISSFINAVSEYEEESEDPNLSDYLQNISLLSAEDKTEDSDNTVTLMTMHSAKGLEFDLVFIVGLEDGLFPSKRTIEEGGLEEERRLFYVAITRARKRLFLTSASSRRIYGSLSLSKESRFIDEIRDHIEEEKPKDNYFESPYMSDVNKEERRKRDRYVDHLLDRKKSIEKKVDNKYKVGDKVKHKKFGLGTIVMIVENESGDEITVAFDNKGLKRLNALYAPLEVVNGK